ncbi:heterokaryon incompatibility protein-domain-containing protein [Ilyonectria destructans]|nr:heterokaryon incompatibility protein-domain-containing protein [Ilyonectria destructans]
MEDPKMPPRSPTLSCGVCKSFLEAATRMKSFNAEGKLIEGVTPPSVESLQFPLGNQTQIFTESECKEHQPLLTACVRNGGRENFSNLYLSIYEGRLSLQVEFLEDDSLWANQLVEFLLLENSDRRGISMGRSLDRDYIDPRLVQQWIADCAEHHGTKCSAKLLKMHSSLKYLIDCVDMCLVPAPEAASYIALSYVWGQVPTLKAKMDNLEKLQEKGIFNRLEGEIAATIRDSMRLVPMLGKRYLWVDSLCIVQDDEDSLRRHISQMASIFEYASLAIIAADGKDASSGLPGLRNVSKPRTLPPILKLTENLSITARMEDQLRGGPLTSRGWTMQEQIFSRKKLAFFKNSVRWICRSNTYYEDIDTPHDLDSKLARIDGGEAFYSLSPLDLSLDVPDLSVLCNLTNLYNQRDLTFDEDVISAFASTFSSMSAAFPHGFVYGLPAAFFDAALLWRSRGNRLVQRVSSNAGVLCPPSWTWAGWQGYLESHAFTSACYMKNGPFQWSTSHWEPYQAIPMLTWYTRNSKDGPQLPLPFQNKWYDYKRRYMGKEVDLPDGWVFRTEDAEEEAERIAEILESRARHLRWLDDPECEVSYQQLQTTYYYDHPSCPNIKFWHPVPLGVDSKPTDTSKRPPSYWRYLCAQTQRAKLWGFKPRYNTTLDRALSYQRPYMFVVPMFGISLGVTAVFRNEEGDEVGELGVDSEEDLRQIYEAEQNGVSCDIVAVSRGLHYPDPQPVERETWSFYNVLWVVWEDGIAYRKGVGRVMRSVWEGLQKEDISLVLG